eukprot:1962505-Rhodomonas_salina.1
MAQAILEVLVSIVRVFEAETPELMVCSLCRIPGNFYRRIFVLVKNQTGPSGVRPKCSRVRPKTTELGWIRSGSRVKKGRLESRPASEYSRALPQRVWSQATRDRAALHVTPDHDAREQTARDHAQ